MNEFDLEEVVCRAQRAIARAKSLTVEYGLQPDHTPEPGAQRAPSAVVPHSFQQRQQDDVSSARLGQSEGGSFQEEDDPAVEPVEPVRVMSTPAERRASPLRDQHHSERSAAAALQRSRDLHARLLSHLHLPAPRPLDLRPLPASPPAPENPSSHSSSPRSSSSGSSGCSSPSLGSSHFGSRSISANSGLSGRSGARTASFFASDDERGDEEVGEDAGGAAGGLCEALFRLPPQPLVLVAHRLALLQHQQAHTLHQLLILRLEQLRLRQQQLLALQELLRSEVVAVEGTPLQAGRQAGRRVRRRAGERATARASGQASMQVSAVHQAVGLLSQSLADMRGAAGAIQPSMGLDHVARVAERVSRADSRAEEVSRMARQLLSVLREFPRREEDEAVLLPSSASRGASEEELLCLRVGVVKAESPLLADCCSICLSDFQVGDPLACTGCQHFHHAVCLREWLRVRMSCPLCKHVMRGGGDGDEDDAVDTDAAAAGGTGGIADGRALTALAATAWSTEAGEMAVAQAFLAVAAGLSLVLTAPAAVSEVREDLRAGLRREAWGAAASSPGRAEAPAPARRIQDQSAEEPGSAAL